MGWLLVAHIGLPLFFGIAFVIFSAAVSPSLAGWDVLADAAQDLSILGLGATGSIFDNATVARVFGMNSALLAISVIAVNLILSAIIVLLKARAVRHSRHFSLLSGILTLFLGFLTLCITAGVLVWAYKYGS